MSRKCPTCGRQLGPVGECLACGGSNEKKVGLVEALIITGIVIGLLGAIGFGVSKMVGNPFQVLNRLKLQQNDIHEVTLAAKDLPVSREPQKTLTLDQIEQLRELFENRQFAALNAKIEAIQQDFEDDFNNEYKLQDAFSVFDTTLPLYEALFEAWIAYSPEHFAPYLASAHYYHTKGWESRGYGWARDTTQEQFRMMHQNFQKASDDAQRARDIYPRLLTAYIILIGISNATGNDPGEQDWSQAGLELFPHSFLIRSTYMNAITPRWGGSYRQMENFAKEAEAYAQDNPYLTCLYGYIYCDQAKVLKSQKKYGEAATLYTKAIAFGDSWYFYNERAKVYHHYLKAPDKALADADYSIYLRATREESYRTRARIHFQKNHYDAALDDLHTAIVLSPADSSTLNWQEWAGTHLLKKGHKIYKTDLNQAIDNYNLSLMFYPDNVEAHYWRGAAYSRLNELDLALADLEKAIELDPRHFSAYLMLDYTLFQRHELDRIVQYWNQFIELEPDHPRAYLERSGTYYHKKDFANALKDLKKSCELGNKEACTRYDQYKDRWAG
ncbi:MAG: tetratricopeptide repeat protein [Desulfobacterales bacterium]|jgi:tetratricopeptide (TPR) repeat protein